MNTLLILQTAGQIGEKTGNKNKIKQVQTLPTTICKSRRRGPFFKLAADRVGSGQGMVLAVGSRRY